MRPNSAEEKAWQSKAQNRLMEWRLSLIIFSLPRDISLSLPTKIIPSPRLHSSPVRQKMGIPFGFSVSDIAKAIKISREIHDSCYSEDQGAGQSIHHLARPRRQVIDRLSSCFQLANVEFVRTSCQVQRIHQ